jgi:hypothetical protein
MGPPSAAEDSSGEPRAGVDPLKISPARQRRARGRIEQTLLDGDVTPTDLRPSLANRTIPQEVTDVSIHDKGPGYYVMLSRILQMDFGEWGLDELRRMPLPRTPVH